MLIPVRNDLCNYFINDVSIEFNIFETEWHRFKFSSVVYWYVDFQSQYLLLLTYGEFFRNRSSAGISMMAESKPN